MNNNEKTCDEMGEQPLLHYDSDLEQINQLYDECLHYLQNLNEDENQKFLMSKNNEPDYDVIDEKSIIKPKNNINEHSAIKQKAEETPTIQITEKNTSQIELKSKNGIKKSGVGNRTQTNEGNKTVDETENSVITPNNEFEKEILELPAVEAINKIVKKSAPKLPTTDIKFENELKSNDSIDTISSDTRSERLRRLSQQLPKIIITQSHTSLDGANNDNVKGKQSIQTGPKQEKQSAPVNRQPPPIRRKSAYGNSLKRLVSKSGMENVALISNVPFGKIRLLNDTFHTLINLRWRWIVVGTVVVHFAIWFVFAVFWYITAWAHYDFEPDPPKRACVTGGKDFVTIFLASVEAQTTIGFGDRAIDEECPESIFLFIMQLILGTGLSGVLTCVVYAKLTRPEKLSRDGVGFSKKAVISMRDGNLCLMIRAWDLNYDHIINSEFAAHLIYTHRTKEGETMRYYAKSLVLQQRQFLLWPVTLVHVIDSSSPLYRYTPEHITNASYEITVSLKGASASMGTFTQSQTSYLPREVIWGHRFPPVVKYDFRKRMYVIDSKKLDTIEAVETPYCSASQLSSATPSSEKQSTPCPGTPSSFSEKISAFQLERTSSFKKKTTKS